LRDLLEFVTDDLKAAVLAEALATAREIEDRDSQAEALSALINRVADNRRETIAREVIALMQ
jgi:hypothetical protein